MEVCNVKIHTYTSDLKALTIYISSAPIKKRKPSFCVLYIGKFVYSIYYKGYINISGIHNIDTIEVPIQLLAHVSKIDKKQFKPPVIDNITAVYNSPYKKSVLLPIPLIKKLLENNNIIKVKYNREKFPGIFSSTGKGTIIWFATYKIVIVGAKSKEDLNFNENVIKFILQDKE